MPRARASSWGTLPHTVRSRGHGMMARSAVRDDAAREAGGRAPNAGDAALPARKLPTPDALNSTSTSDRIPQPRGRASLRSAQLGARLQLGARAPAEAFSSERAFISSCASLQTRNGWQKVAEERQLPCKSASGASK